MAATIHVHVWDIKVDMDEPIEEVELELTGLYDDRYQFSGQVQGKHLEVRIWKKDFRPRINLNKLFEGVE